MTGAVAAAGAGLLATVAASGVALAAASPAPTPLLVVATPCAPAAGSSTCTADPTALAVTWPSTDPVGEVTLAWVGAGRPAGAPAPASTTEALPVDPAACTTSVVAGTTTCSWSWPGGERSPAAGELLNGTYQVVACANDPVGALGGGSPGCTASPGLAAARVGVGVAPIAPVGVAVTGSSPLTVRWTRSGDLDLAGYRLARDGRTIWSCTTDGERRTVVCPAAPQVRDAPPAGRHTYTVTALAFGAAPSGPALAAAAPAVAVTVRAAPTPAGTSSAPAVATGAIALGPVPYTGPAVTVVPAAPPETTLAAPATTVAPDSGFAPTLPYATHAPAAEPVPVAAATSAPRVVGPSTTTTPTSTLDRTALFALGMLILAIASHLIFLRSEMRRREALWRALRDAASSGRPIGAPAAPRHRSPVSAVEALLLWRPGSAGRAVAPRAHAHRR